MSTNTTAAATTSAQQESPLELLTRIAGQEVEVDKKDDDEMNGDADAPLDFSMKSDSRPSVIIRKQEPPAIPIKKRFKQDLSAVAKGTQKQQQDPSSVAKGTEIEQPSPPERVVNTTSTADGGSDIDEHFKRSLGLEKYKNLFDKTESDKNGKSPDPLLHAPPSTVDDHFAKALGQSKWDELQRESGGDKK